MREVIAVCRSEKRSRNRVATVLDRYFWRIGDRTWRGKATNACLDRLSRELRKRATRNTAVVLHEVRSSAESRKPLIRIGSRHAFSDEGVAPVSSHPADFHRSRTESDMEATGAAVVGIAALFHDLGKATALFQAKLRRALEGGVPEADAIRHELVSAAVWDDLCGDVLDGDLGDVLRGLTPQCLDRSAKDVRRKLQRMHADPDRAFGFRFLEMEGSLSHLIGLLILTHHRLPAADADHETMIAERHVCADAPLNRVVDLAIAPGTPFWHETWWQTALQREASRLRSATPPGSGDIAMRASLMLADHIGSAKKTEAKSYPEHLANTLRSHGATRFLPADSLSRHVKRVYYYSRHSFKMTHKLRDSFPAIDEAGLPVDIAMPPVSAPRRFAWQGEAARAARALCKQNEGGFFAAILAGTGTGKTRGAPTILANAAMGDTNPQRRYFRMSLALGLRVLATQSAREYVDDLGFQKEDVSVLVGDPPLEFGDNREDESGVAREAEDGSESLLTLPEWLKVERAGGRIPDEGAADEENWLRGLSLNTDRGMPSFLDLVLEHAGRAGARGRLLLEAPIMVATIDHLMGVAAPVNSRFLLQSLRLMTSDLILDEIDQYDGEDLAAIGRLVYQAGAMGRRVVVMSATLTPDIAEALHAAYSRGWADHARAVGVSPRVNLLFCGDAPGSVFTNEIDRSMLELLQECRQSLLAGIVSAQPLRRGEVLPPCDGWSELVEQVGQSCSRLHDANSVEIENYRVSMGMVRLTRITHTAAMAIQMPAGNLADRIRVLVCLHAQMPRLHRAFIETRLKRALTRKGQHPDTGVRALCGSQRLFERASALRVRDIEIVVVTTPVIETGNDLDFDYAILDPISTRSIVQSAGRVRRHRPPQGSHPNVFILGRSPVVMQDGCLMNPGVETKPSDDTRVPAITSLSQFEGRHFVDLAGDVGFEVISAAPFLSDGESFPLREAETVLRRQMTSIEPRAPLGAYLSRGNARWNLRMTRSRKFRRSETREVLFCMIGDSIHDAEWYLDLDPGTRNSCLRQASQDVLHFGDGVPAERALFDGLTGVAWNDLSGGARDMNHDELRALLRVNIPSYGDAFSPEVTYTEFTGFTRGASDDLFAPFGKTSKCQ